MKKNNHRCQCYDMRCHASSASTTGVLLVQCEQTSGLMASLLCVNNVASLCEKGYSYPYLPVSGMYELTTSHLCHACSQLPTALLWSSSSA